MLSTDEYPLAVAIMTFNRPAHLANCVESVRRHLPDAQILIMDDASDDPGQRALLSRACSMEGVRVIGSTGVDGLHGGLYGNMQRALEECPTRFLLYLQDDTQLVRSPCVEDLQHVADALAPKDSAFVYPFFIKAQKCKAGWYVQPGHAHGLQSVRSRGGALKPWNFYTDICVADTHTLRQAGWRFQPDEKSNGRQAQRLFQPMWWLFAPWGFYCPEVPIFRHRDRAWGLARALLPKAKRAPAFFNEMDDAAITGLKTRAPDTLAFAEDHLSATRKVRRPFVYQDVKATRLAHMAWAVESKLLRR